MAIHIFFGVLNCFTSFAMTALSLQSRLDQFETGDNVCGLAEHDAGGAVFLMAQGDGPPVQGRYPTTAWAAGETFDDAHSLNLPATLPPGPYSLLVGLYDPVDGRRLLTGDADHVRLAHTLTVLPAAP